MNHAYFWTFFALLGCLYLSACQPSSKEQSQANGSAASGLSQKLPTDQYAEEYDCVHCGMPAMDFPQWQVKATTDGGREVWFCSPKCMFLTLHHPKRPLALPAIEVTEYYELGKIDARSAYYVVGSDMLGPMGHDLVPLATKEAAQEYRQDHGGKQIYRFEEVTPTVLQEALQ